MPSPMRSSAPRDWAISANGFPIMIRGGQGSIRPNSLKTAVQEVARRKWKIINLDCTISAEQPRLSSHKSAIRGRIAELLGIAAENVNVKAKTGEGVGPVGRQEVIEADAVVLLAREPSGAVATMTLRVYNTLTRQKEDFQTLVPGQVRMYLCGPTVYKPSHIGHMVGPVIFDTVKRYLTYNGYQVKFVINITDVDDKLINRAREEENNRRSLARQMTQDYFENLERVGVGYGRRVSLRDRAHHRDAEDHRPADRKGLRISPRRGRVFRGHQGP